ncbi:MAG: glycosyltransferase family 2 protein [Sphingobacteriales bacterium]|nr:MAG: glycosyltransferase family 2 protein [Sphingobacteriales bacterium]
MDIKNLWVIMPVYNEEEALPLVLEEWRLALDGLALPYTLCVLNDGSKDQTGTILNAYAARYPQVLAIDKPNSGHGQTCVFGYKLALEKGADWVFQIDSDGQCDPQFFPKALALSATKKAVFGYRKTRDDGFKRVFISKFVRLFTLAATSEWVRDPNVPYRLMHRDVLMPILSAIPNDFHLANIWVSVLVNKQSRIAWIPIHFRDRSGGSPSVKTFSFVKHGFKLFRQLRAASKLISRR